MFVKISLTICLVLVTALAAPNQGRINNGKPVEIKIYPFMSVIHSLWHYRICGATILNKDWVLTSARCLIRIGDLVSYGTQTLDERYKYQTSITKVVVHPDYNMTDLTNDLALVQTRSEIPFGRNIQPVTLSKKVIAEDEDLQILGWGQVNLGGINSNNLQYKNVTPVEIDICREELPNETLKPDTQVCTYGTRGGGGGCTGDQGGPLLSYPSLEQVGILSWGGECGSGKPTVNTRVQPYLEWIESIINE